MADSILQYISRQPEDTDTLKISRLHQFMSERNVQSNDSSSHILEVEFVMDLNIYLFIKILICLIKIND